MSIGLHGINSACAGECLTVALLEKNPTEADFEYPYGITKCKAGRKHLRGKPLKGGAQ